MMALEQICGLTMAPYMEHIDENVHTTRNAFEQQLKYAGCNLKNVYALAAPPYENPAVNMQRVLASGLAQTEPIELNFEHGTTTVGFKYQGGIILAVDSRSTGGQYIGSQNTKKIVEINHYLLGTMAGGAADCVYWDRVLARECRLYELRNKRRISVASAARLMANIAFEYKGMGLSMGMMLAGYDGNTPQLYYTDASGMLGSGVRFAVGSGSLAAIGILDTSYRYDLSNEEAYELAERIIYHAARKDVYSGGIIRVYHVQSNGWKHVTDIDYMDVHAKCEHGAFM